MRWNRRFLLALLALPALVLVAGCDSDAMEEGPFTPRTGRGATLSTSVLSESSVAEVQGSFDAFGLPLGAAHGVTVHKIVYETIDAQGATTQASGALFIPRGTAGPRPLVTYQHGTLTARNEAPSAGGLEQIVGLAFATSGYVAVLPDLLGLGDSPGLHPYVHAASSASAVVDMLRAVQDFAVMNDVPLSGQLFIAGYSQGGYTAMAAHREIEANHRDEFQVTASAPMAGPYDLSGTMADVFLQSTPHPAPYYLPYALLAYDAIYGLFDDPSEYLAAPYDDLVPPLFDGTNDGGAINAVLPEVPVEILSPALVAAFRSDPDHPLRVRLRENDVYDWTPQAPMQMYHCGGDRHVPQANTRIAFERFQARGAARVEFIDPLPVGDHGTCAGPSLLLAKVWFDGQLG